MTWVMVASTRGVNEYVYVTEDPADIEEKLLRWLPELRAGRVAITDFGYKRGVVSENGNRSYEIFKAENTQ